MLSSVWTSSKPGADNKTLKTEKHDVRTDPLQESPTGIDTFQL